MGHRTTVEFLTKLLYTARRRLRAVVRRPPITLSLSSRTSGTRTKCQLGSVRRSMGHGTELKVVPVQYFCETFATALCVLSLAWLPSVLRQSRYALGKRCASTLAHPRWTVVIPMSAGISVHLESIASRCTVAIGGPRGSARIPSILPGG